MAQNFKTDEYSEARGGSSAWLSLSCSNCRTHLATYQTDGPDPLIRCYLNRFAEPFELANLDKAFRHGDEATAPDAWHCESCSSLIGLTVPDTDGRLAFGLLANSVTAEQLLG